MEKIYKDKFWVYSSGLITNFQDEDIRLKRTDNRTEVFQQGERFLVYQAICECYHPNWFPGCIVHHLDNDSSNNNIANLYVCKNEKEHHQLFHMDAQVKATKIAAQTPKSKKWKTKMRKIKPEMEKQFLKDCKMMTRNAIAAKYKMDRHTVLYTLRRLGGV